MDTSSMTLGPGFPLASQTKLSLRVDPRTKGPKKLLSVRGEGPWDERVPGGR